MGRGNDLERSDGSDGDGTKLLDHAVPRGARLRGVVGRALPVAALEEPKPAAAAEREPDAATGPEPAVVAQPTKRVASEMMKAALLFCERQGRRRRGGSSRLEDF
jgi:hypothetical protein